jgi:hypothetical protein
MGILRIDQTLKSYFVGIERSARNAACTVCIHTLAALKRSHVRGIVCGSHVVFAALSLRTPLRAAV